MNVWPASADKGEAGEPSLHLSFPESFILHNHCTQVLYFRVVGSEPHLKWHKSYKTCMEAIGYNHQHSQSTKVPMIGSTNMYLNLGLCNGRLGLPLCSSPSWEVLMKPTLKIFQGTISRTLGTLEILFPKFTVGGKWQEESTTCHRGNPPGSPDKQWGEERLTQMLTLCSELKHRKSVPHQAKKDKSGGLGKTASSREERITGFLN